MVAVLVLHAACGMALLPGSAPCPSAFSAQRFSSVRMGIPDSRPEGASDLAYVPPSHRSLHDSLYGDDDDHGAGAADAADLDGSGVAVETLISALEGKVPVAGVYAIADASGATQYVGYSRDVAKAVLCRQAAFGAERVHSVTVSRKGFATRADMEAQRQAWVEGLPEMPPGNDVAGDECGAWESPPPLADAAYEAKKAKLIQAMGEGAAVEEDVDWGEEVDAQTAATLPVEDPRGVKESPFARETAGGEGAAAGAGAAIAPLTVESVDLALEEVRPFLVADGGNIDVVSVDASTGEVRLALVGACSTCPSAAVTMEAGVEACLRKNFPTITKVVNVVDQGGAAADEDAVLRLEDVEQVVSQLRPAIEGMGGKLRVVSVTENGIVTVSYTGPARVQYGVDLALRDNDLVRDVVFVEGEAA